MKQQRLKWEQFITEVIVFNDVEVPGIPKAKELHKGNFFSAISIEGKCTKFRNKKHKSALSAVRKSFDRN